MDFITQCYRGIREQTRRKAETIARARQGRPSRNSMTKQLHNTRHPTFLKNKTHKAHGFLLHSATEGNFHQLKENDVSHSFSYFKSLHFFELDDADKNWSTPSNILFLVCPRGSGCLAKEVEVGMP